MISLRKTIAGLLLVVVGTVPLTTDVGAQQGARRSGGTVLAEVPYIVVTTCADQVLRIGPYFVLCNDYSYPYHYGGAVLIAETWGRDLSSYKLCLDGANCLQVELLRRQP